MSVEAMARPTVLESSPTPDLRGDMWVFGYGSLIWRPGFDFLERRSARLTGSDRLPGLRFLRRWIRGLTQWPGHTFGYESSC